MELIFRDKDKLLLFIVVLLVECCKVKGLKFNYLEVVVLISVEIMEGVCEGCFVVELMSVGIEIFIWEDVMDGVVDMVYEVQVEVIFFDGMKLVIVYNLIV